MEKKCVYPTVDGNLPCKTKSNFRYLANNLLRHTCRKNKQEKIHSIYKLFPSLCHTPSHIYLSTAHMFRYYITYTFIHNINRFWAHEKSIDTKTNSHFWGFLCFQHGMVRNMAIPHVFVIVHVFGNLLTCNIHHCWININNNQVDRSVSKNKTDIYQKEKQAKQRNPI